MIPVDIIEADDEQDAKKKLLAITSQYGEFDMDGFMEFTSDIEIDDTIRLTDGIFEVAQPDFKPVSEDEQGKLDEKQKHTCPECGCEF